MPNHIRFCEEVAVAIDVTAAPRSVVSVEPETRIATPATDIQTTQLSRKRCGRPISDIDGRAT